MLTRRIYLLCSLLTMWTHPRLEPQLTLPRQSAVARGVQREITVHCTVTLFIFTYFVIFST